VRGGVAAEPDHDVDPSPTLGCVTIRPMSSPSSAPPSVWSAADLATLAQLAETFVRGESVRRARLAAEGLDLAADPAQVRQLRLVLRLIQSRAINLALTGRATAYRDLSPADRERYLLGWAGSRIPLRRSAFQAFRKLLTFLAYADPGEVGTTNPLHVSIGYEPDRPPITSEPTIVRPFAFEDHRGGDAALVLDADVVVVGSGAGGGVAAAELTAAGRSVVVLEAGPFVDESTMPRNELDAYSRLYLDHGLLTTWDGSVTMLAGTGVGGGTVVNWMTSIAAPQDVRAEWAREHGIDGIDGREFDDDLEEIERALGVTEAAVTPPKDQVLLRGAAALGWEAAPSRRNATGCGDCGSCPFGCPRGSKQSGLRVHLAAAHRGGARIIARARVARILIEAGHAVGVEAEVALADPNGDPSRPPTRPLIVRAPQVIVAAGALRTPAVLVASGLDHPAIGRNLRLHPVPVIAGLFDEPIDMWRGTMQAARSLQFGMSEQGRNGYAIESAPGHPGLIALALPWEGTNAHADLLGRIRRIAPLIAVTRDGGEGRVRTTRAGRVRIDYGLDATGIATMRHALVSMAQMARAAGARTILAVGTPARWYGRDGWSPGGEDRAFRAFEGSLRHFDFSPNRGAVFSAHQMGTARMGSAAPGHACDSLGRVRVGSSDARGLVRGLYVADGAVFPTGLGVNPQITIMALARRISRTVVAEGRDGSD
jgi:choline dehydrogenase-like flavoprotein